MIIHDDVLVHSVSTLLSYPSTPTHPLPLHLPLSLSLSPVLDIYFWNIIMNIIVVMYIGFIFWRHDGCMQEYYALYVLPNGVDYRRSWREVDDGRGKPAWAG